MKVIKPSATIETPYPILRGALQGIENAGRTS